MNKRIIFTISEEFLAAVDGEAEREQRSRSELVRAALREYLVNRGRLEGGRGVSARRAASVLAEARRESAGKAKKGSDNIRHWRYRLDN